MCMCHFRHMIQNGVVKRTRLRKDHVDFHFPEHKPTPR